MDTEYVREDNFDVGPLSMLKQVCTEGSKVLVNCRNNRKLFGRIRAFDRHTNMVMEDVQEFWSESRGGAVENKERFMSKLFVRGDSVVLILRAPKN